jgi:galactokinase
LAEWAYEFEFAMCRGGGMDQLSVILGGALLCQGRTTGLPGVLDRLEFPSDWSVVVVDSATPKSTQDHIRSVRARAESGDHSLAEYMTMADRASDIAWRAIRSRDLGVLAKAMDQAYVAMRDLQAMSTPLLERLRDLSQSSADFHLKLTGAGGGGALVGVCPTSDSDPIVRLLRRAYQVDHPEVRVLQVKPAGFRQPV